MAAEVEAAAAVVVGFAGAQPGKRATSHGTGFEEKPNLRSCAPSDPRSLPG